MASFCCSGKSEKHCEFLAGSTQSFLGALLGVAWSSPQLPFRELSSSYYNGGNRIRDSLNSLKGII